MAKVFFTLFMAALCAVPTLLLAQADALVSPGSVAEDHSDPYTAPVNEGNATSGTPTGGGTDTTSGTPTPIVSTLAVLRGHYVTLREATPQRLTFVWKMGANIDNIKVTVRRNNSIVATRILPATDSMCTVQGITFHENDILQVTVAARTQLLSFKAKFRANLQDNMQARSTTPNIIRPLATVESIHPRRRNQLRTTTVGTAPVSGCAWVNNADLNDRLYYKINDVGGCVQTETTDSIAFYTCLEANLAYFTFDNGVYFCDAAGDGTSPNRISKKIMTTSAYPNPFQNEINVKCHLANDAAFLTVQLADIGGNVIYTHQANATPAGDYIINIPTIDLPQGIYFYTINSNGSTEKGRVVKMN
jgi:hypothetical protein